MKKFLVVLAVAVNGLVFGQVNYSSIDNDTKNYLNQFGIFYIGAHDRYLVVSGKVEDLPGGTETTAEIKRDYAQFIKWKPANFKLVPDVNPVLTFKTYFSDKILEDATEFAVGFCGADKFKIVNYTKCEVNNIKLNVKSIDIIETCIIEGNETVFSVFIFFTNHDDVTELLQAM
jgi:hypothetical protein